MCAHQVPSIKANDHELYGSPFLIKSLPLLPAATVAPNDFHHSPLDLKDRSFGFRTFFRDGFSTEIKRRHVLLRL